MANRYTETDKWRDKWFRKLKPESKLIFLYLIDNCDLAGFIEIDEDSIEFDTGLELPQIETALKDIEKCYIKSDNWLWVKKFIKYQKNTNINPNNPAHKKILELLKEQISRFSLEVFEGEYENIQGHLMGHPMPLSNVVYSNGNGKVEKQPENFLKNSGEKKTLTETELEPYLEKWNKLAKDLKLPQATELNYNRKRLLKRRLSEKSFDFDGILTGIRGSPLLQGADPKFDFKPTFDWIIDDKQNYLKIMEGNYKSDKYISPFTHWKSNLTGKDSQLIEFDNEKEVGKLKRLDGTGEPFRITKYDLLKQYSPVSQ